MTRMRSVVAACAAATALTVGLALPAAADVQTPQPGPTSTMPDPTVTTVPTGGSDLEYGEESEDGKGGKWKGGYVQTPNGVIAFVYNRKHMHMVGVFETTGEAQEASESAAAIRNGGNGVMAGPGCNPPFVLC